MPTRAIPGRSGRIAQAHIASAWILRDTGYIRVKRMCYA